MNSSVCGLSCLTSVQTWVSKLLETSTQLQLDTTMVTGQLVLLLLAAQGSVDEEKTDVLALLKLLRNRFPRARYMKAVSHDTHEVHDRINEYLREEKVQVQSTLLTDCLNVQLRSSRQYTQCGTGKQSDDTFEYIMVIPGHRTCKLGSLLQQYCQIDAMRDYLCETCDKKQTSQVKYGILKINGASLVVRVNRCPSDLHKTHTKVIYGVQQVCGCAANAADVLKRRLLPAPSSITKTAIL